MARVNRSAADSPGLFDDQAAPPSPQPPPSPGGRAVQVLLPLPLGEPYDYRVPADLDLAPGDVVEVPLGPRQLIGVVWGDEPARAPAKKLKNVLRRLPASPLGAGLRAFIDWVAAYTLSPPGQVLRMAISVPAALEEPNSHLAYKLKPGAAPPPGFKMTEARRRVLAVLDHDGPPRTPAELAAEAGCGPTVVRGLAEAGLLEPLLLPAKLETPPPPDFTTPGPALGEAQGAAAEDLRRRAGEGGYSATLLDGVTGSGKTEVYFEAVAAALAAGKQALVLLPEIALSAQWFNRFAARFGAPPCVWHSEMTVTQRRDVWRAAASGAASVVVGARSALFLPMPNLGLIIVDEEHDGAYKQDDGVTYHARDMAVVRAHLGKFPIVLASATPSLETQINVEAGRYLRLHLPSRHGVAELPDVKLIDLRVDRPPARQWLAPSLRGAITDTLAAGEQVMLFLNRRGYAPLTLCRTCGFRLQCPNCTAWLVEHRGARRLQCHHCGYTAPLPESCPSCGTEGSLHACGPGVERIAEEVADLFPDARTEVVASDTIQGPAAMREAIRRITDHEVDIVIGTQVLAKGHHFPMLTLVGVVDADLGLGGGDLRAAERTYQLLHQVSGRAGRGERAGRVLLQTFLPEHPVMHALAAGDRDGFYELEAEMREEAAMPPFGRLAALIVSSEDESAADKTAMALRRAAPDDDDRWMVLGPAPAPLALLRGRHRRRLLLKAPRGAPIQATLRDWLARVEVPHNVRVAVDIDPQSFL
jgi:primosomal protein N' (replication factor Y) (superfamily II helicase)